MLSNLATDSTHSDIYMNENFHKSKQCFTPIQHQVTPELGAEISEEKR